MKYFVVDENIPISLKRFDRSVKNSNFGEIMVTEFDNKQIEPNIKYDYYFW